MLNNDAICFENPIDIVVNRVIRISSSRHTCTIEIAFFSSSLFNALFICGSDKNGNNFAKAGIEIEFSGTGVDEIGKDKATGKVLVKVNPKFFRPAEGELLIGSPKKAEEKLGWKREISFDEMVERMVKNDLELCEKEIAYANSMK